MQTDGAGETANWQYQLHGAAGADFCGSTVMTKPCAQTPSRGPLHGLRILEFSGIGPAPWVGMLLADMGADVIVIVIDPAADVAPADQYRRVATNRGKRSMALDLKCEAGRAVAWKLLKSADALIEGFPPGVMDQLGFGADAVAARHPRLVYGRASGSGSVGALPSASQPAKAPVIWPAIGERTDGAMLLAFGMVCALYEAKISGRGQVVAAMSPPLVPPMSSDGSWLDESPFCGVFDDFDGQRMLALVPRLSRTPARQPAPGAWCGEHTDEILTELAAGASPVSAESQCSQDRPALASAYATSNYL